MIVNLRESTDTSSNNDKINNQLASEFYSWKHSFDDDSCFLNRKRKINNRCSCNSDDHFNCILTKTKYRRISESPSNLSQFELFSNVLKLEDFVILNTLGKSLFLSVSYYLTFKLIN